MKYTKILIEYDEYPSLFNRTILVKGNPDLFKLASFFAYILGSQFCHCYYFETDSVEFVMSPFMEQSSVIWSKYLGNYYLSDLPNKFTFVYDTGEDYKFKSTILSEVDYDSKNGFILLDANGQGIWEDNHSSLYAFLSGEISPNSRGKGSYTLPWNFNNKTFKDFFKPINTNEINETLCKDFSRLLPKLRKNEDEYIIANHVSLEDLEPDYEWIKHLDELKKQLKKN